jgi:hypothetical protein
VLEELAELFQRIELMTGVVEEPETPPPLYATFPLTVQLVSAPLYAPPPEPEVVLTRFPRAAQFFKVEALAPPPLLPAVFPMMVELTTVFEKTPPPA